MYSKVPLHTIDQLLEPYAALEKSVRELMPAFVADNCELCATCCCQPEICEETTRSAFLSRLLRRQGLYERCMSDRYGWLDTDGCILEYGRPPACYAYFCDELLSRLPDDNARLAVRALGGLLEYVGRLADGRQMTEIEDDDGLAQIDVARCVERIEKAERVCMAIAEFVDSGHLSSDERARLLDTVGEH